MVAMLKSCWRHVANFKDEKLKLNMKPNNNDHGKQYELNRHVNGDT